MFRLVFGAMPFRRHRRDRPRKSGGPSLFELSLKIQRNVAHIPNSGLSAPVSRVFNARGPSKVHLASQDGRAVRAAGIGRHFGGLQTEPTPAAFLVSWRGHLVPRSQPAGHAGGSQRPRRRMRTAPVGGWTGAVIPMRRAAGASINAPGHPRFL